MATMVNSFSISGVDAYQVDIEVKTMDGQPMISVIGLGDQAVKEAADRIQSAIDECGYEFPKKRVIISLAPSDKKKSGSHFDLAMAIGVLQQETIIACRVKGKTGLIGELSLNGTLRPCRGVLPMVIAAKKLNFDRVIVPAENVAEAKLVHGIEILGFEGLCDVIDFWQGKEYRRGYSKESHAAMKSENSLDFADVKGHDDLIDAVALAAAGGHNILMIGEPGCGKTMIAQRIPTILPEMSKEERLELTKIYSISGLLPDNNSLISDRPFRAPHHNASLNALIGGGTDAMPGEVSLAHNGVLFLDELAEFSRRTLDALRQPVENKQVTISRVNGTHTYPANFMLVAAMNPCPCGYHPSQKCRCTDYEIIKYRGRISGPIMDRIDIQKEVHPVDFFSLEENQNSRSSAEIRTLVKKAREIQQDRYRNEEGINCNAQIGPGLIKKYCELNEVSLKLLRETCESYGYSARVIHKLLRLARTSADMRGDDHIRTEDVEKVLSYRDLDRSNSSLLVVK